MSSLDPSIIQVASFKYRADVPLGEKNVRLWELTEKQSWCPGVQAVCNNQPQTDIEKWKENMMCKWNISPAFE